MPYGKVTVSKPKLKISFLDTVLMFSALSIIFSSFFPNWQKIKPTHKPNTHIHDGYTWVYCLQFYVGAMAADLTICCVKSCYSGVKGALCERHEDFPPQHRYHARAGILAAEAVHGWFEEKQGMEQTGSRNHQCLGWFLVLLVHIFPSQHAIWGSSDLHLCFLAIICLHT